MGIYGVDFYGTAYYGINPLFLPSDYSVAPFVSEVVNYNTQLLVWAKPQLLYPPVPQGTPQTATPGALQDLPTARVRLVKNSLNIPSDEEDGITLFDLPLSQSPVRWQDNQAVTGSFTYYTVWVYDGYQWQRGGDCIALTPNKWGYSDRLFGLLPAVHRTWDQGLADPASLKPIEQTGPLQRFLQMIGLQYDLVRTEIDSLLSAYDPHKCSGGLLPVIANQLGWNYEQAMGMRLNRHLLENLVYYYKTKGTMPTAEGIIADITGWSSNLSVGYNMVLDENNAAHTQSVGLWSLTPAAGVGSLSRATIPVTSGPANPPVIGPNSLLGPTTVLQLSSNTAITGSGSIGATWSLYIASGDATKALLQGVPLMQGATTVPYITISRYFYGINAHSWGVAADFFNSSGIKIGSTHLPTATTSVPANTWTRASSTFAVPPGAVTVVYYWFSVDSFAANEKTWTTAGQVEAPKVTSVLSAADSGFETWTGNWLSRFGANASQSTDFAHSGTNSLKLVNVSSSGSTSYGSDGSPLLTLTPGQLVTISAWFRPGSTVRSSDIGFDFVNSSFGFISSPTDALAAEVGGAWVQATATFTAPAGTAYGVPFLSVNASVAGEAHYIDDVEIDVIDGPQQWQPARQLQVDLRPDRVNLVSNPSFDTNITHWAANANCAIQQAVAPSSTQRWPVLRNHSVSKSPSTQVLMVSVPPGTVNETDYMLAHITTVGNTSITPPGGWKLVKSYSTGATSSDVQTQVYARPASNEPTSYPWLFSNAVPVTAGVASIYNVDLDNPVDLLNGIQVIHGSGSTINIPAQTLPSSMGGTGGQIIFISTQPVSSIPEPAGMSYYVSDSQAPLTVSGTGRNVTSPGPAGAVSITLSQSALWAGIMLILKASPLPATVPAIDAASLEVVSSAPGAMSVISDPMVVTPGLFYAGSGFMIGQSLSQPVQMGVNWYSDAAGTVQLQPSATSPIFIESTVGGSWVRPGAVGQAPAGAAAARLVFQWNFTNTSGEPHFLDQVLFEQASSVRSYFDGGTPLNGAAFAPPISADYLWEGAAELSPSVYYNGRTRKNLRLGQVLPSFLPAGASFSLEYALPN